jgi:hypothetical protein
MLLLYCCDKIPYINNLKFLGSVNSGHMVRQNIVTAVSKEEEDIHLLADRKQKNRQRGA